MHEPETDRGRGRMRRALTAAALDVSPLRRHRDLRLLFAGQGVSMFGSMITYVALPYQAYQLSHSSLVVGLLGLAELLPLLTMPLLGGALADAVDRRAMVRLTELLLAVASVALAVNAADGRPRLWVLFAISALMAGLDGLQRPSLDALLPRLVERDEIPAASALTSMRMTAGQLTGPAVGGVLIATAGLTATYAVDVVTFLLSLWALELMQAVPPPPDADRPSLRGVIEGLRYARSRPELIGTYLVDTVAMFFGMPNAVFPAVAAGLGGAGVLGLLYTAPSVGSLLATVASGWIARVHRHGAAVCVAAAAWGAGIVVFGLAPDLAVALVGLAIAGGVDEISGLFRSTIWNQTIPDHLRGRLAGIEQISYSAGPILGDVEAGSVAALAGVRASVISGGLLCIAGVGVAAMALPAFWRYDRRAAEARV